MFENQKPTLIEISCVSRRKRQRTYYIIEISLNVISRQQAKQTGVELWYLLMLKWFFRALFFYFVLLSLHN